MAGIPCPKSRIDWLIQEPWAYDAVIAICSAILGVIGARKFYDESKPLWGHSVIAVIVISVLIAIRKNWMLFQKKKNEESVHDLEGCLHTLHAVLTAKMEKNDPGKRLRITIHVPRGDKLQQVLNYVGDSRQKNTRGRSFATQCGIIGVAFRKKRPVMADRVNNDYESYIEELKDDWSYSEEDARKLDPASKAWMAVPLVVKGEIQGVLYMDAIVSEFFTEQRQEIAKAACVGIGRFVQERYFKT